MPKHTNKPRDAAAALNPPTLNEIKDLAFWLYVYQGKPQGRRMDHWLMAENVLISEWQMCVRHTRVKDRTETSYQLSYAVVGASRQQQQAAAGRKQPCLQ